jgi:hypothetical protein
MSLGFYAFAVRSPEDLFPPFLESWSVKFQLCDLMERRRKAQDDDAFGVMCKRFAGFGFTRETLLVLLPPQFQDAESCIPLGEESYMESMRDLARFIEATCRAREIPDFFQMKTMWTLAAELVGSAQQLTLLKAKSPESFCPKHVEDANTKLGKYAVELHPKCSIVADRLAEAKSKISEDVRRVSYMSLSIVAIKQQK